jgi:hypothetical protein
MDYSSPYLPYIIKSVVAKVNTTFSTRLTDPFNVFFDYGLYVDVAKNIYKKENAGIQDASIYPLIWLVEDWDIRRGEAGGNYGEATFDLILAMPTSNEYTADQRTENVFLPRLLPIYDELVYQLSRSKDFSVMSPLKINHTVKKRSYWGGNEGGQDAKNLFKNFIDALYIPSMTLTLKNKP